MKAKEYQVLQMAVNSGVSYGLHRLNKYMIDAGSRIELDATQLDTIVDCVIQSITEWFDFPDTAD